MELEEGRLVQELKEVGKLRKNSGGSQGSPGRLRQTPTSKKGSYQTDDSTLQWRQLELHSKQRSMRTEDAQTQLDQQRKTTPPGKRLRSAVMALGHHR